MASTANMMIRVLGDVTDAKRKLKELDAAVAATDKAMSAKMASINNGFTNLGGTLRTLGGGMQQLGAKLTTSLTVPLALLGGAAMKMTIEFEKAFAGVRKTIDAPIGEDEEVFFQGLRTALIDLSNKLGVPKEDLAAIMQMAGQLGIRGTANLSNFTEAVAKLNITTGIAPDQLAQLLGKFGAIVGLNVEEDIMKLADVITALGNNSATTEKDIMKFGIRMAAAGKLIGLTPAQILAIGAASESTGTKAERGGSAVTKIFMAIQSEASKAYVQTDEFYKLVKDNGSEMVIATKKLNDAKMALDNYTKSGENDTVVLYELQNAVKDAQVEYDGLMNVQENLGLMQKLANNEQGGFAKLLGLTSAEFATLAKSEDGGMIIFQRFIDQIYAAKAAGKDIGALMKELGLGDVRLMQAVQSLSEANNDSGASLKGLADLLGVASSAWEGYGDSLGATDTEVKKRLDTTSAQWSILKEVIKSISLVFTDDLNGALKDVLRSINTMLINFLNWLNTLKETVVGTDEAGNSITALDVLVQKVIKTFITLMLLGPGLSVAGSFVSSFGMAFQVLGTGIDIAQKAMGKFNKSTEKLSIFKNVFGKKSGAAKVAETLMPGTSTRRDSTPVAPNPVKRVLKWLSYGKTESSPLQQNAANVEMPGTGRLGGLTWAKTGKADMSGGKVPWLTKMGALMKGTQKISNKPIIGLDGKEIMPPKTVNGFEKGIINMSRSFNKFTANIKKGAADMGKNFVKKTIEMKAGFGDFAGKIAQSPIGQFFSKLAFQLSPITNAIAGLLPNMSALLGLFGQGALILGGWAVILALVAAGLTIWFMSTGKGAEDVRLIFENLGATVTNFFGMLMTKVDEFIVGFPAFAEKFGAIFSEVVTGITNLLVTVINSFFTFMPKALEAAGMIMSGLLSGFIAYLPQLLDSGIQIIMALLNGLWSMMPSVLKFALDMLVNLGNAIIDAIPILLKAVVQLSIELLAFLWKIITDGSLLKIGVQIIQGIIMGLWSMITNLLSEIGKLVGEMIGAFLRLFGIQSPSKVFAEIGSFLLEGMLNGIKTFFIILMKFWEAIPGLILGVFSGVGQWLFDAGKSILTGLWDGINWYYKNVFKLVFNVRKWIIDAMSGAGSWLFDIGKDIIQGLIDGFDSLKNKLFNFFGDLLPGWVVSWIKGAFGIKSPSRVFMGIGENLGLGLIAGMDGMQSDILAASDAMANAALIDPMALNNAMTVNGGTMTHDYSGLASALSEALTAVGLEVYMDGKKVTDVVSTQLALDNRRIR